MSVKRIRCTDDVQKRGIAKLREAMKGDMAIGLHWKLQRALECFELSHVIIKELLKRAEGYQERDIKAKAVK
ncbi:hypothetical protein EBZ39_10090 [bacterium]|nr:hypothetical protein [bacterium]